MRERRWETTTPLSFQHALAVGERLAALGLKPVSPAQDVICYVEEWTVPSLDSIDQLDPWATEDVTLIHVREGWRGDFLRAVADLVLGFDALSQYETQSPYFGCTVGRVAFRIAGGKFDLDGRSYQLTLNEGGDLAGMAWRMLDSSGYLDLWTRAEDRERLERRFHLQWRWPAAVPSHLIVLREESRSTGTFATSRLYPRTWLLHSLGVDKDARRRHGAVLDLAGELYAAMLRLLKGETAGRFFALFVQKDKRWTELLYGGFVRTLPPGAPSVYDEYVLYKCRTEDEPSPLPADAAGWSVREAGPDELARVVDRLRGLLTPTEIEAYSYGEDEIDLRSFSDKDPAGFRRRVLVAQDAEGPAAALVLEGGREGINVFRLLNSCRIFLLRRVAVCER